MDAGFAAFVVLEIGAGDFFEGQKAVAVGAVIDEAGFQRGFDAGDDTLVDIAFALLFAQGFDVQVEQGLAVNDGHAQFFRMAGVKQHAFHGFAPFCECGARKNVAVISF